MSHDTPDTENSIALADTTIDSWYDDKPYQLGSHAMFRFIRETLPDAVILDRVYVLNKPDINGSDYPIELHFIFGTDVYIIHISAELKSAIPYSSSGLLGSATLMLLLSVLIQDWFDYNKVQHTRHRLEFINIFRDRVQV